MTEKFPSPAPAPEVPQGPRTEFVLNELRSALNGMLTFFGMDEDENSKAVFDKARQAYNYAEIVMRPLEPWERQSLEDFRACVHRWHEKAVSKGYDGVEAMCDTAMPYGTRDLHLVSASPAVGAADDMLEPLIQAAIMHNGTPKTVAEFERAATNVADMLKRRQAGGELPAPTAKGLRFYRGTK